MKPYQIIIAVCIAIAFIGFCVKSCSSASTKKVIEYVLEEDHQIATRAPSASGSDSIDDWIRRYEYIATEMRKIDLSACPDDFAQAYSNHWKAWGDSYLVLKDIKAYQGKDTFWQGFLNGLLGRGGDYVNELNAEQARITRKVEEADKAVHDTYDKVLEIASKHGVRTSKYR